MFWEILNKASDLLGVISAVLTALIFLQLRVAKPVTVSLVNATEGVVLSFEVPRQHFSRAELLGRLGMYSTSPRFQVASFSHPGILASIDAVTHGRVKSLTIPLEDGEVAQFRR